MKKKGLLIILTASLFLTGCSLNNTKSSQVQQDSETKTISSFLTENTVNTAKKVSVIKFNKGDLAPIVRDGKVRGFLKMNQVQKLGIWNWQDPDCTQSPIRYSYTINFKANFLEDLESTEKLMLYIDPFITNASGDKIKGKPCILGWSGFAEHPTFNTDTKDCYFEYGVQPSENIEKSDVLRLKIKDSEGREYDDVIYSASVFKNPEKGRSLITKSKPVTINSVNGGKYKVDIVKTYKEYNYLNTEHYASSVDIKRYPMLMFTTKITYLKAPTNKKNVPRYDLADDNTLRTALDIGVQTNLSEKLDFENRPEFLRAKFSDRDETERYVLQNFIKIHEGCYVIYNNNRTIELFDLKNADSVRYSLQLDSEVSSLKPKQIMKFDGRFIVFQEQFTTRKLHSKDSGKTELNKLGTNDKNAKKDN